MVDPFDDDETIVMPREELERIAGVEVSPRRERSAKVEARAREPVDPAFARELIATAFEEPDPPPEPEPVLSLERVAAWVPDIELVGKLGRGGMATVFEGRMRTSGVPVAVKVLHPELARDVAFTERFAREAVALARLSHPNIVRVLGHRTAEGQHVVVMEHVAGLDLREVLSVGPLDRGRAIAIAGQLAEGLGHAHGCGVIHRDVKPDNVLVAPDGTAKLTDFGVAKLVVRRAGDVTLTATLDLVGTPAYMAPEQLRRSRDVDPRADVYSLGVLLHEMLTGSRPELRDGALELRPIDRATDRVIARATAPDPGARQPNMAALARDLAGIRDDS